MTRLCARTALEKVGARLISVLQQYLWKTPYSFSGSYRREFKKKTNHLRFSNVFAEAITRLCNLLDLQFTERLEQFRRSHWCRNPLSPGFSIRASALLQEQPINAPKQERGDEDTNSERGNCSIYS